MATEAQVARRRPIIQFLQEAYGEVEGVEVIGFGLIVEIVDSEGERGIHKITASAGGHPLPYYVTEGMSSALDVMDEVDDDEYDDDQ